MIGKICSKWWCNRSKEIIWSVVLCLGLLCYGGLGSVTQAQAATLDVCASGCTYSSIQAAINAAVDGDTVLVDDGTYVENINFLGKAITVQSVNGAASTIIDGNANGSVVTSKSGEGADSVLDGFTITNGSGTSWEFEGIFRQTGGGFFCEGSSPTIYNCTISGNSATGPDSIGGGIICVYSSSPTIYNCTISNNTAWDSGGIGCHFDSSPTITNSSIRGNTADDDGGGVHCTASSPTITNCNIISNTAADRGGGILCDKYLTPASPMITNCTISGNTAGSVGGGINSDESSPIVVNTILWEDSPDEISVYAGTATVTYSDIQGGYSGEGNINADPLFVGGDNYHLTAGSPCIDAGRNDAVELPTDFEGDPRIIDGDNDGTATVDMGADEFGPPVPDIKANGSDGPIGITLGDALSITIELDPGDYPGFQVDWWVVADTPFDWYYYDNATKKWLPGFHVSYQGALFGLTPPAEVLNTSGLPEGTYDFYFGVDGWRNGRLDYPYLYYDSVRVNITP